MTWPGEAREDISLEEWDRVIAVHLRGAFLLPPPRLCRECTGESRAR